MLDMGSVEAPERRAMLEAVVLAAARPAKAGVSAPQGEAAVEEGGEGGLRRRERLAVDPRPAELQRQEEELRKAQRVREQGGGGAEDVTEIEGGGAQRLGDQQGVIRVFNDPAVV